MIATLRTLTRKSKMGFGKIKDCTVQELIDRNKKVELVAAYYKLSSINFTEDILDELKITEKYRIKKPSTNKTVYRMVLSLYPDRVRNRELEKLRKPYKGPTKGAMQSRNHGR